MSELDVQLAEIDRLMHAIETGLRDPDQPEPNVTALVRMHIALLEVIRELVASLAERPPQPSRPVLTTVEAGPFAGTRQLSEFVDSLERLPGVHAVAVRGYEGADRAVIEVQLGGGTA